MTEDQARDWLATRFGTPALGRLECYVDLLLHANREQNLISRSSEGAVWARHIADSAQLLTFAPGAKSWLDVGSGAGLPGIVIAALSDTPMLLVEPRRKRVEFLQQVATALDLNQVEIRQGAIERIGGRSFDAVTARAYASLATTLGSTIQLTEPSTIWVLPKGRRAEEELDAARKDWQGMFHVEQSLTDADSRIVIATNVQSRCA